jgi:hypothetical protein
MFDPLLRFVMALAYGIAMLFAYRALSAWWSYAGFDYQPLGVLTIPLLVATALPSLALPKRPRSLAAFASWVLFYSLFMPALIIPPLQGWVSGWRAGQLFFVLLASTFLFIAMTGARPGRPFSLPRVKGGIFWTGVLSLWIILHGSIVLFFGASLSLAGFDSVYEQRSTAALLLQGGLIVYVLSNAAGALNPFLVATGIADRKWWRVPLGVVGQVIVYSSLAGKIVLVFPIVIGAAFLLFDRSGRLRPNRIGIGLTTVALIGVPILASYVPVTGTFSAIVDLVYFRTLYLPGVLVGAYYDFFSIYPVTYFSHSIIGRAFFEYPYGIWSVGQVVGAYVTPVVSYDQINNYNANFIASDGIAGLGLIGVPVSVVLAALILRFVDRLLGHVDLRVRCAAFVPFIMWLSDGSLFTALLTGGGVLITLLVWLWGCTKQESRLAALAK